MNTHTHTYTQPKGRSQTKKTKQKQNKARQLVQPDRTKTLNSTLELILVNGKVLVDIALVANVAGNEHVPEIDGAGLDLGAINELGGIEA